MIEVYHTSNTCVKYPDTIHSRKNLDFGPGFYFTTIRSQAEKYGLRFTRFGEEAWLNIYIFNDDFKNWKVIRFDSYNEEWLDFVMMSREGNVVGDYDLIIGGIANDKVFDTLDLYLDKLISKEEALNRLIYQKPNIQYCIRSESMIKEVITFKEAIKL